MDNILLLSDSYKVSHWRQYPPGTEYVYSYFESRGCDRAGWDEVCFFGLQYFVKRYLCGVVVTREKIEQAAKIYAMHFGDGKTENPGLFYREGWEYILEKHGGKLPVKIRAVPEGMVVPNKAALITVVNTDPECFWLTNFLETLLVQVWYPMTVCTNSRQQKLSIQQYLEETGCEDWSAPGGAAFKLHDFGMRGVSSVESAALGGLSHLVNFLGSDTVVALVAGMEYYGAKGAVGFSIPASEHSTITSWGVDGEVDAMKNMLEQYPEGLVACVSDSFDVFKACREYWGSELKDLIKGRISEDGSKFGQLVVRPDSGDPEETCVSIMKILLEQFKEDVIITKTGHKLLPPYIRIIQGDGVDYIAVPKILRRFKEEGMAAANITFGSGGSLLQKLNRDTFKVAFKCSEITVNGETREVFKDPITDNGKASKKGRLTLQHASDLTDYDPKDVYLARQGDDGVKGGTGYLHFTPDGKYVTVASGKGDEDKDLMVDVFEDGDLVKDWTLGEIRKRADVPNGPFSQEEEDLEVVEEKVPEPEKAVYVPAPFGASYVDATEPQAPRPTYTYQAPAPGMPMPMPTISRTMGLGASPTGLTGTFRSTSMPGSSYTATSPTGGMRITSPYPTSGYTIVNGAQAKLPSYVAAPPNGLAAMPSQGVVARMPSYVAAPQSMSAPIRQVPSYVAAPLLSEPTQAPIRQVPSYVAAPLPSEPTQAPIRQVPSFVAAPLPSEPTQAPIRQFPSYVAAPPMGAQAAPAVVPQTLYYPPAQFQPPAQVQVNRPSYPSYVSGPPMSSRPSFAAQPQVMYAQQPMGLSGSVRPGNMPGSLMRIPQGATVPQRSASLGVGFGLGQRMA